MTPFVHEICRKCIGFIRTLPSHPHAMSVQRNRHTLKITLTTRSTGLRRIRLTGLLQTGHRTGDGSPIATSSLELGGRILSLRDFMAALLGIHEHSGSLPPISGAGACSLLQASEVSSNARTRQHGTTGLRLGSAEAVASCPSKSYSASSSLVGPCFTSSTQALSRLAVIAPDPDFISRESESIDQRRWPSRCSAAIPR